MKIEEIEKRSSIDEFLNDFKNATFENGFNPRQRVYKDVIIELSKSFKGVRIHDIRAIEKGKGKGTAAMRFICNLADKYQIPLALFAKSYDDDDITNDDLSRWYEEFNFKKKRGNSDDGFEMIREPSSTKPLRIKLRKSHS